MPTPTNRNGLYNYGGGGIGGWGSLCGTLNGACAVLNLMNLHGKCSSELMGWYQTASIPSDRWATPYTTPPEWKGISTLDHDNYEPTQANSQLCHISISKFCAVNGIALGANPAGLPYTDPSKTDRCAKLCGDVAARAAELINECMLYGGITPQYELPETVAYCLHCHNDSSSEDNRKDISGKLDCTICHTDPTTVGRHHPYGGGGGGGGGGM